MSASHCKMIALLLASVFVVLSIVTHAAAGIVASTSFENEPAGSQYVDTGDPDANHDLVNNIGQSHVNSTAAGSGAAGDLGFTARYEVLNIGGVGLTDGDDVGVVAGAFPDGSQGYSSSDVDGVLILEFDAVPIISPTIFEIDYFIGESSWEASDFLNIYLTIDGSSIVTVFDTAGVDIDTLNIESTWFHATANLAGLGASAVLTVATKNDAASETFLIDRVVFSTTVPEPASAVLVSVGAVVLWLIRRRK